MLTDRCIITNHPCGTDTRLEGTMCPCAPCMRWASETIELLMTERDRYRSTLADLVAEIGPASGRSIDAYAKAVALLRGA